MINFLLAPANILGTIAILIGLLAVAIKANKNGREWLVNEMGNKLGKFDMNFLGWPLVIAGMVMCLPFRTTLIIDAIICVVFYVVYRMQKRKSGLKQA